MKNLKILLVLSLFFGLIFVGCSKDVESLQEAEIEIPTIDKNSEVDQNHHYKRKPCGGTGGMLLEYITNEDECNGWGVKWWKGACYACY